MTARLLVSDNERACSLVLAQWLDNWYFCKSNVTYMDQNANNIYAPYIWFNTRSAPLLYPPYEVRTGDTMV